MRCPDELTWAIYADGETVKVDTQPLSGHLAVCRNCRELVAALQEENRALVHAIQGLDEVTQLAMAKSPARLFAEVGIGVIGFALSLRMGIDYVTGVETPLTLQWANPFRFSSPLNFLATSFVYLINEGGPMLASIFTSIGVASLIALGLAAILSLLKRASKPALLVTTILLLVSVSFPGYAIDIRGDRSTVTVAASEMVDDTLLAYGDTVIIDGTITGDLIAAARRVKITGTVQGDVLCAAENVEIGGNVEGNVYAVGESVQLTGMARNLYAAGQSIRLAEATAFRGNMMAAAESIVLDGQLGRDMIVAGREIEIRGMIGQGIRTYAQRLVLLPSARVGGDLQANVPTKDSVQIESGAVIGGKTDIRIAPPRPSSYLTISFYLIRAVWLAVAFVTGLIFFWLFPFLTRPMLDNRTAVLKTGALGFVAAIATPVAAVVAALTIVGIPVALFTLVVWVFGLYIAKIVLALFFGRALLSTPGTALAVELLAGLLLIAVAVNLPYLGTLINIILTLLGFGAVLLMIYRQFRPSAATALQIP
jgi:cytoskeletal protein CcmA (bactofilin family)